ncbi:MAG: MBL fold metallo-hydrolase [Clostridiales bacterium]|nr:MBL fold metallo-hydrolase [Clostridiales bacterium]MDO4349134.1 MBL fold metallo-hydrolase [Eubacteriales bacterium]MDY4007879.1 MBL fold metallo-hydrolase [Candidatus Limiplasma sp.]
MILKYMGHSFFTLTLADGTRIALDPYGAFYQYPRRRLDADICLISHHHHDHDGVECINAGAEVIDRPGVHQPARGLRIVGVPTWHDGQGGTLRGPNIFYVLEAEGLRVGHAGDLGHVPDLPTQKRIGHLDVLMLPVGGYYTIDAAAAYATQQALRPTVTVPMHYRTPYDEEMPIAPVEAFLHLAGAKDEQLPILRFTSADIHLRPQVVTLAVEKG